MENGNKKLLWLIAVVNVLTFILLIAFIIASWDVITMKEAPQPEIKQQTPTSTQQQMPQAQQQTPQGQQQPPAGGQIQPPTGGTTQGKCGDGVCGPVEKEKGICPEDCK